MVQLRRDRAVIDVTHDSLEAARAHFQAYSYLKLPGFLEPTLLRDLLAMLDRTVFYERVHTGIGTELCATPGAVTGALELLLNDPALRPFMADLTGVGPLGCYEGRVYRLNPKDGHYDSWHSDVGEDRQLAVSINLSGQPFQGGRLQIRRAESEEILAEVDNPVAGDAVIFRVHPSMRHRVASVMGQNPRTAWAGWYRTEPQFADLLRARLAG